MIRSLQLRVNRRTAPALYLDVIPLALGGDGVLRLGGEGEAVDGSEILETDFLPSAKFLGP